LRAPWAESSAGNAARKESAGIGLARLQKHRQHQHDTGQNKKTIQKINQQNAFLFNSKQ
jgi:hypothetical protein